MINELPTIFEVVTGGGTKKPVKEKSSVSNNSGNKSKSNSKVVNNIFLLKSRHEIILVVWNSPFFSHR